MLDGVRWGWTTLVRSYERDRMKSVPETPLTHESVHPDRFNKMNVALMKKVFHQDTLSEITHHLASEVEFFGETCNEIMDYDGMGKSPSEQTLDHVKLLKDKLEKLKSNKAALENPNRLKEAFSDVFCLEFLAHMSFLHIETFMNRHMQLTEGNIVSIEKKVKKTFDYLQRWKQDQLVNKAELKKKDKSSKEWEK